MCHIRCSLKLKGITMNMCSKCIYLFLKDALLYIRTITIHRGMAQRGAGVIKWAFFGYLQKYTNLRWYTCMSFVWTSIFTLVTAPRSLWAATNTKKSDETARADNNNNMHGREKKINRRQKSTHTFPTGNIQSAHFGIYSHSHMCVFVVVSVVIGWMSVDINSFTVIFFIATLIINSALKISLYARVCVRFYLDRYRCFHANISDFSHSLYRFFSFGIRGL